MRLEILGTDNYLLFINSDKLFSVDFDSKEEIIGLVKEFIIKIQDLYCLNMNGFYKIRVFPNKVIGLFMEIEKMDDIEYEKNIDLRIIVYLNEKFYLKVDDFDFVPYNISSIYYMDHYYMNMNDIEEILSLIEYGEIVYGSSLEDMLQKGIKIKNTEVF